MAKKNRSDFSRNVLTLMTGTSIAQFLPLLLTPVLTRLFSPEEFGLFAFYTSIVTFIAVISSGRYEPAIVLPKEDKDAINILALCFIILSSICGLLFILLTFLNPWFETHLNRPALQGWLWFIPVCVFFVAAYRILTFWSNRKKRFKGTSVSIMGQAVSRVGVHTIGGFASLGIFSGKISLGEFFRRVWNKTLPDPTGISALGIGSLIVGFAAGFFSGTLLLLFPFLKKDRRLLSDVSKSGMRSMAKLHEKFPKVNSLHALGDELKNIGVTTTILYAFTDVILGFYSMTVRILKAPLSVIGNSFAQVFYQKAAEMHANRQNYVPLINSTVKKLAFIALPIFIVIAIFGPQLFEFVLGSKWKTAGVYAQYLSPWLFASFVVAPIQQVAVIVNKQMQIFLFSLLGNCIIFGSILLGGLIDNLLAGFILLSVLQTIYFLSIYLWIQRIARESCREF
ncbi:oligosaccharide flippase family protein [Crocinitomix catalasitica]|nr:oligosaccharide flippase family protein [Crocinitomix catalasitica]